MKYFNPYQIIDLRFQVDHMISQKIHLFEKYRDNPNNAWLFMIPSDRKIKFLSDGS